MSEKESAYSDAILDLMEKLENYELPSGYKITPIDRVTLMVLMEDLKKKRYERPESV